jgi:hypothetical protein
MGLVMAAVSTVRMDLRRGVRLRLTTKSTARGRGGANGRRYAALVAAVAEGKAITQDRYLRKRVGNALYGRFQFMPIRLGLGGSAAALSDGVPPYYIGMYTKEVLSEEAEVTIPEIPEDTMEQLLENATQLVQEIHTEKRCVSAECVCVCVCVS